MRKHIFTLFGLCAVLLMCAQNVEIDAKTFPNQKDGLRDALKSLDLGTELYNMGRKELDDQKRQFLLENKFLPVSLHDYQRAG